MGSRAVRLSARVQRPGAFDAARFGFVHADLKYLTRLQGRPAHAFVAIGRRTRFGFVEVIQDRAGPTVAAAFERFLTVFAHPVHTVLTDRATEGATGSGPVARGASDQPSARSSKQWRPCLEVERFNRRLAEALRDHPVTTNTANHRRFTTQHKRTAIILGVVADYNRTRLRCLNDLAPIEALDIQRGTPTSQKGAITIRLTGPTPWCARSRQGKWQGFRQTRPVLGAQRPAAGRLDRRVLRQMQQDHRRV